MKKLTLTIPEYVRLEGAFREWLCALGYAETTSYSLPLHLREFLWHLEHVGLSDHRRIDAGVVEVYFSALHERPNRRRGGGLSRSYLLKHRQALRLFSRYLYESGQGGFRVPPTAGRPRTARPVVLKREEVETLYEACSDDMLGLRDRAMLALFYGCGLRRSEGVGLDIEDVLLQRELVYVRRGKNYRERYVPLARGAARDLAAYFYQARPVMAHVEEAALLVSQRGRRVGGQSLLLRLKTLCEQVPTLSEKEVGLHTLRHSVATHLLEAGMPLEEIAQFLGHASLESTQLYTHLAHGLPRNERDETDDEL